MKILQDFYSDSFDLGIFGLGFESRSITAFAKYQNKIKQNIAIGYHINTDKFSYPENLLNFNQHGAAIYEGSDDTVFDSISKHIKELELTNPADILLDITVMSRHRLATILCLLIDTLPTGSQISIVYSLSEFIAPPTDTTPIKQVCEISSPLSGTLGDLSEPTAVILGLGYEKNKALGVSNFLDADLIYAFIPESPVAQFKEAVLNNNNDLLSSLPNDNIFYYDVCSPYSTYLNLRSLVLALQDYSRPLLVPLGPKILASLSVLLGKELYPNLPVWRVSSNHTETPVDRPPSGVEINYTILT